MKGMLWMRKALKGRRGRFMSSSSSRTARVLLGERVMSASWSWFLGMCFFCYCVCGLYFGWRFFSPAVKVCAAEGWMCAGGRRG